MIFRFCLKEEGNANQKSIRQLATKVREDKTTSDRSTHHTKVGYIRPSCHCYRECGHRDHFGSCSNSCYITERSKYMELEYILCERST